MLATSATSVAMGIPGDENNFPAIAKSNGTVYLFLTSRDDAYEIASNLSYTDYDIRITYTGGDLTVLLGTYDTTEEAFYVDGHVNVALDKSILSNQLSFAQYMGKVYLSSLNCSINNQLYWKAVE